MAIIEVNDLGKKYVIGERLPYLVLRDTLGEAIKSPIRWLRGQTATKIANKDFWALKDVSFSVEQGETLGIIGRNGSGKSTLLKILSRITPPTVGSVRLRGAVGSLLEVGTGFHPELTGRENIFLNGAILGMRRAQILKKIDEIIEFSGVAKFIDTPVKRYSSGMYVRLAFSVAAHLEPDILIVDEVLAVGDAEFQKKCLGKMEDVTRQDGRTVLFVSHNMEAIGRLCGRVVRLDGGTVREIGPADGVIRNYLSASAEATALPERPGKELRLAQFSWEPLEPARGSHRVVLSVASKSDLPELQIGIGIDDGLGRRITTLYSKWTKDRLTARAGDNRITCDVHNLVLKPGRYSVSILISGNGAPDEYLDRATSFTIPHFGFYASGEMPEDVHGNILASQAWRNE